MLKTNPQRPISVDEDPDHTEECASFCPTRRHLAWRSPRHSKASNIRGTCPRRWEETSKSGLRSIMCSIKLLNTVWGLECYICFIYIIFSKVSVVETAGRWMQAAGYTSVWEELLLRWTLFLVTVTWVGYMLWLLMPAYSLGRCRRRLWTYEANKIVWIIVFNLYIVPNLTVMCNIVRK